MESRRRRRKGGNGEGGDDELDEDHHHSLGYQRLSEGVVDPGVEGSERQQSSLSDSEDDEDEVTSSRSDTEHGRRRRRRESKKGGSISVQDSARDQNEDDSDVLTGSGVCSTLMSRVLMLCAVLLLILLLEMASTSVQDKDVRVKMPRHIRVMHALQRQQQRAANKDGSRNSDSESSSSLLHRPDITAPPTNGELEDAMFELDTVLKASRIDPHDKKLYRKYVLGDGNEKEKGDQDGLSGQRDGRRNSHRDGENEDDENDDEDEDEDEDGGENEDEDEDGDEKSEEDYDANNSNEGHGTQEGSDKNTEEEEEDEERDSERDEDQSQFQRTRTRTHPPHFRGEGFDLIKKVSHWERSAPHTFDLVNDALFTNPSLKGAQGKLSDSKSSPGVDVVSVGIGGDPVGNLKVVETEQPRAPPGEANRRFRERPNVGKPPKEFLEFLEQLRQRTYSHVSKYVDAERKLKELGYRQSTHKTKKIPAFLGYDGESCPKFTPGQGVPQASFCTQFLPAFREQEQQQFLYMFQRQFRDKIKLKVQDFFPLTWRLYKQAERRALKSRASNDSLAQEGGPYITKYTFSHNAGKPSLTVKIWDLLKKSDHSEKIQVQEAKQKMIVQKYINDPFLFQSRKFVIRTWALILNTNPLVVLYNDGALLRSMPTYSPFIRRDGNYKRAAHFTNAQSSHKGTLRSSSLYSSLGQFQQWLDARHQEGRNFVNDFLRPRLKARMIYALYAMLRPPKEVNSERSDVKKSPKLPPEVTVVQPVCFDFLLDKSKNVWLLGVTTGFCAVNLGGDGFRPGWKQAMQAALGDGLVLLTEELLWRKANKLRLAPQELTTDIDVDMLIDETLPGWNFVDEINDLAKGKPVDKEGVDPSLSGTPDEAAGGGNSDDESADFTDEDDEEDGPVSGSDDSEETDNSTGEEKEDDEEEQEEEEDGEDEEERK